MKQGLDIHPTAKAISPSIGSLCPQGMIGFIKSTTPTIVARTPKMPKNNVTIIIEAFLLVTSLAINLFFNSFYAAGAL